MAAAEIVFQTDVPEPMARKFDKIAENNFRSRAQHLKFIIEKEIEFHEKRDE